MLVRVGVMFFEMPLGFHVVVHLLLGCFFFQILQISALARILNNDY